MTPTEKLASVDLLIMDVDGVLTDGAIIYDDNGVVVRSWPAIHAVDGPVSYSLE